MAEGLSDGILLYQAGFYDDALTFFLQYSAESVEEGMELAYYTGLVFSRLERYEEAMQYFEQIVTAEAFTDTRLMQCRLLLAVIYTLTGRTHLAGFEIDRLLESGYKPSVVLNVYAYMLWQQDRIDECIAAYERSLSLDKTNATAMNGLGFVLTSLGRDLTRALTLCQRSLEASPENPARLDSLGWLYYNLGLLGEAETYLSRAKSFAPDNKEIAEHYRAVSEKKYARGESRYF